MCLKADGTPKAGFASRERAEAVRERIIADGAPRAGINTYPCDRCGKWHVGNIMRVESGRRRIRRRGAGGMRTA
jgi:hypothetical protein